MHGHRPELLNKASCRLTGTRTGRPECGYGAGRAKGGAKRTLETISSFRLDVAARERLCAAPAEGFAAFHAPADRKVFALAEF